MLTEIRFADGPGKIRTASDMIEVLRLHFLLISLTMVEVVEVGHDDRHRKSDGEHTGNSAQRSNNFAPYSHRPVQ